VKPQAKTDEFTVSTGNMNWPVQRWRASARIPIDELYFLTPDLCSAMAKLRLTDSDDDGQGGGKPRSARSIGPSFAQGLSARTSRWWSSLWHQGDNPLFWALPLFSVAGISVRLGLLYVLFIVMQLSSASASGAIYHVALAMGGLAVIVLLHEFGHCIACRMVGGQADRILLWPLGGLAYCQPPFTWRANFWTTAGGPLVNVALAPILALALLLSGVSFTALYSFNPLLPLAAHGEFVMSWAQRGLWWLYYANLILLAFNVLLPMYPMDGGRLLQALLWRKMGYRRSMSISINIGLAAAILVGCYAIFSGAMVLLAIAIFGGITCMSERARLAFIGGDGYASDNPDNDPSEAWKRQGEDASTDRADISASAARMARHAADRESRAAKVAAESAAAEQSRKEAIDLILAKIKATGMGSLSKREKALLAEETNQKRQLG